MRAVSRAGLEGGSSPAVVTAINDLLSIEEQDFPTDITTKLDGVQPRESHFYFWESCQQVLLEETALRVKEAHLVVGSNPGP